MSEKLETTANEGYTLPNQKVLGEYDGIVESGEGIIAKHTIKAGSNWKANSILRGVYNQPKYQDCTLSALERRKYGN
ncbi:MAG: hypothetical protein ABFQ65_03045 [Nanoarchaeota archaeon]